MQPLVILLALAALRMAVGAQEAPAGPLYHEAVLEFTSMKTTLYQHKTEVDREAGSYKYDCVRFVSYAMRETASQAWETILREMKIVKGHIPGPTSYQKFFELLLEVPRAAGSRCGMPRTCVRVMSFLGNTRQPVRAATR